MFCLYKNQAVGFHQQNVWKSPVEEWHLASKKQLPGLPVSGTLVENKLNSIELNQISPGTVINVLIG